MQAVQEEKKVSLHDLEMDKADIFAELEALMEETEPDQNAIDDLIAMMDISVEQIEQKLEQYAWVRSQNRAEADRLTEIADNIKARAKRKDALADMLEDKISEAMVRNGIKSLDTDTAVFKFRKSEQVIVNTPAELLPKEYCRTKTTHAPDKAALKKALKGGVEIPGVSLREVNNLQIK